MFFIVIKELGFNIIFYFFYYLYKFIYYIIEGVFYYKEYIYYSYFYNSLGVFILLFLKIILELKQLYNKKEVIFFYLVVLQVRLFFIIVKLGCLQIQQKFLVFLQFFIDYYFEEICLEEKM